MGRNGTSWGGNTREDSEGRDKSEHSVLTMVSKQAMKNHTALQSNLKH